MVWPSCRQHPWTHTFSHPFCSFRLNYRFASPWVPNLPFLGKEKKERSHKTCLNDNSLAFFVSSGCSDFNCDISIACNTLCYNPPNMVKYKKPLAFILGLAVLVLAVIVFLFFKPQSKKEVISTSNPEQTLPATAILEIFEGEPEVKLPGEEFKIAIAGMEVTTGTAVKTNENSRAQILYANKSVTRLDYNTEITLQDLENEEFQAEVKLEKGRIWSRIAKLFGKETYESQSDKLVATIRGTSYGHEILTTGEDRLIVTKSKALGKCLNNTQKAEVISGNKAIFSCLEGKKITPVLITLQDKKDKWYIFNNEEDKKLDEKFGKEVYDDEPVLGTTATSTPKATVKPTVTPSSTPTPTPTPVTLKIDTIDTQKCVAGNCFVVLTGSGFDNTVTVTAKEENIFTRLPESYTGQITSPNTSTQLGVLFNIPSGSYTFMVKRTDGQSASIEYSFLR